VNGENFDPAEFERTWTNEDTNRKMMQEFDRLAMGKLQGIGSEAEGRAGQGHRVALTNITQPGSVITESAPPGAPMDGMRK